MSNNAVDSSEDIKVYVPKGNTAISTLEMTLVDDGVSDDVRADIVSNAIALDNSLKASESPVNIADAITAIKNLAVNNSIAFSETVGELSDKWGIYNANLRLLSSPDNIIDANFVRSYAQAFETVMAFQNGSVYQELSKSNISVSDMLVSNVMTGNVPNGVNTDAFERTVNAFKGILKNAVSSNVILHDRIYGENQNLNKQNANIQLGEFAAAFSNSNESNETAEKNIPDGFILNENGNFELMQSDIDYDNQTLRKGEYRIINDTGIASVISGEVYGKFGISQAKNGIYEVAYLPAGLTTASFDNHNDAVAYVRYADENTELFRVEYDENMTLIETNENAEEIKKLIGIKNSDEFKRLLNNTVENIIKKGTLENTADFPKAKLVDKSTADNAPTLTDKCTLTATQRTDNRKNIWVISLNDRISQDEFNELRKRIKQHGGNYSRFAKSPDGKSIPGFIFNSEPTADTINVFNDFFESEELDNSESNENLPDKLSNEATTDSSVDNETAVKSATTKETNNSSESIFIDDRSYDDVSSRKVKAFQFDNPEVKPFYKAVANELKKDLQNTIKGERFSVDDGEDRNWTGTSRFTSESIARIKDDIGATYAEIENALDRLIHDKGQENIALAKKIELVIDDMLSEGYTNFSGDEIAADEEYVALKGKLGGTEYESDIGENDDLPLSMNDVLNNQSESDIINKNDEGVVENGVNESGEISENGKRFNQNEAKSSTKDIPERGTELYNKQSGAAQFDRRRGRTIEKRNLKDVCESEKFNKISQFVGNTLTHKHQERIYANYVNDARLDIYDFPEIITYDMLSDENNELRSLFADEIIEYFNSENLSENQDITGKTVSDEILDKTKGTVIVNENGNLIPIYHSTAADFDSFVPGDLGIHAGSYAQAMTRAEDNAKSPGSPKDMFMIKGYGVLKNPILVSDGDYNWTAKDCVRVLNKAGALTHEEMMYFHERALEDNEAATNELREHLIKKEYDGVVYENNFESTSGKSYILFDDSQFIKIGKEKHSIDNYDVQNDVNKLEVDKNDVQPELLETESERPSVGGKSEEVQENEERADSGTVDNGGSGKRESEIRGNASMVEREPTSSERVQDRKSDTGNDKHGESGERTDGEGRSNKQSDVASRRRLNTHNYKIVDDIDSVRPNIADNIRAIELLKELENTGRKPTKEEQQTLSLYKGWGGLKEAFSNYSYINKLKSIMTDSEYADARASILNSHYTSTKIIKGIYKGLNRLGFKGGNLLEPSMGTGNFFGVMPAGISTKTNLYGVEIDSITGRIAKYLYPDANIEINGFQDVQYPDEIFDAVVGNVPFSEVTYTYKGNKYTLHDYFFLKSLDKLKEGGVAMLLTSTGTLDKLHPKARYEIMNRANIIAAFRLPNNAFKTNAGTQVTTDLIVLQKRGDTIPFNGETIDKISKIDDIPVNEYFARHPENILGELVREKGMYAQERTQVKPDSRDFENVFDKAMASLPKDIMSKAFEETPVDIEIINNSKSHFEVKDDKAIFYDSETGEIQTLSGKNAERVKDYISVKESYDNLLLATRNGADINQRNALRRFLADEYNKFHKKFGALQHKNNRILENDSDFVKVSGLELYNPKTKDYDKSDIFTSDTIGYVKPVKAESATDALAISVNETGGINFNRMAELTGKTKEELAEDLSDTIIQTPDGDYELISTYASGNILEKLKAVEGKKGFEKNEELLKAVMPKAKGPSEIVPQLGASWIKPKYIRDFISEVMNTYSKPKVHYDKTSGEWVVERFYSDRYNMNQKYGTSRANAYELIVDALNMKSVKVYDKDSDGNRHLNNKETALARQKQSEIKEAFSNWIFKDKERRDNLVKTYNELFNSHRNMDYGELSKYLTFPGIKSSFHLRDYQKAAVARVVFGGNTLLAHGVGTGKTAEMIASAMELKRMGITRKNVMVVPKHKVGDFRNDILKMYPNAKVLMATEKDFKKENRGKLFSKIATNDWDIIIVGHTSFGLLPVSNETQAAYIEKQKAEVEEVLTRAKSETGSQIDKRFIASLEKTLHSTESKLKDLLDAPKDDSVTFEDLGIDGLFVDEAHNFKNLPFYTKLNLPGIKGGASKRASDLFMKTEYLRDKGGRIVFATATPVTNTISELYNMTRFVAPEIFKDAGLYSFDSWASTFGNIETKVEMSPDGKNFRTKERFSKYFNVPEMVGMFRRFADILKTGDVVADLPKANYVDVISPALPVHEKYVDAIVKRMQNISGGGQTKSDNMLLITSDGRAMATDLRLVASQLTDYDVSELDVDSSRINKAVANIVSEYKKSNKIKGTQFVFLDFGMNAKDGGRYAYDLYGDLIAKLKRNGIPESEIANIGDYDTQTKKDDLFKKVNEGEIRVLIGSTAKMGEGMNAQTRAVALHHLNAPYRPSDIEQREGRIIRYGNINKDVNIYRYIQEKSFDSYMWQMLARKAEFINQAMSNGDISEIEETDEFVLSAKTGMAVASGNPLILKKVEVDEEVKRLQSLKKSYNSNIYDMQEQLATLPGRIENTKRYLDNCKSDISVFAKHGSEFEMKLGKKTYTKRADAAKALKELIVNKPGSTEVNVIGSYKGLDIVFQNNLSGGTLSLKGANSYNIELGTSDEGNITRITNVDAKIKAELQSAEKRLSSYEKQLESVKADIGKPFKYQGQLDKLLEEQARIDTELNFGKDDNSDIIEDMDDKFEETSEDNDYFIDESEDSLNEERNVLSDDSGKRQNRESAGIKGETVAKRARGVKQGLQTKGERRQYAETLKASGALKEEVHHGVKAVFIPQELWNDEMKSIAAENEKNGYSTAFTYGDMIGSFIGGHKASAAINHREKAIVLRYDSDYSPQQLNSHERFHDELKTAKGNKIRNIIKNSIPLNERKKIVEELAADYGSVLVGNEEAIFDEFICNLMAGMSDYSIDFDEMIKDYYDGKEIVDYYSAGEYTKSIDAGGWELQEMSMFVDKSAVFNLLNSLKNRRGIKYNNGRVIIIPDSDMEVLRHTFKTEEHYKNRTDDILDIISCSGNHDKKHYMYVFYKGENGSVAPIFRLDYSYLNSYQNEVKKIADEMGYDFYDFAHSQGDGKGFDRIRNITGRNSSDAVSVPGEEANNNARKLHSGQKGNGTTSDQRDDNGISNGNDEWADNRQRLNKLHESKSKIDYFIDSDESSLTEEHRNKILKDFDKNRTEMPKPSQRELWGERFNYVRHNISRVFPTIPESGEQGKFFAEFRKMMIQWKNLPTTASFMTQDKLNKMTEGLTKEEFKIFSELVYFLDLQEEAKIQKEKGYDEILLPNEISAHEVDELVKYLNSEASGKVKKAIEKRKAIWKELKQRYVELHKHIGFDTDGRFERENYYHHQVIEYMTEGGVTGKRDLGIKAGRGWLKERQGSTKAINTDFLAVEYKAMMQMQYDVYIAETLCKIKDKYDIKPELEAEARNINKQKLNELIAKESVDDNGKVMIDSKGNPDSETFRTNKWYNQRIMFGYSSLFGLAEDGMLDDFNGEYSDVVESFKRHDLSNSRQFSYIAVLAGVESDNLTDAQEQAMISARTVLKYTSKKKQWIKEALGDNYATWETLAKERSDTYGIMQPRRGNYFYTKEVINEDAFTDAFNQIVISMTKGSGLGMTEDLKKAFAEHSETVRLIGAAYEQWVIPAEMIKVMDDIANPAQPGLVSQISRDLLNMWKGWSTTLNPLRTLKFGIRNIYGDIDAVIAGNPQILKYTRKAAGEIYQAMRHKRYSPVFMEWTERGGYSSMTFANEMDSEMKSKLFKHLQETTGKNVLKIPLTLLKGYRNGIETIHNFRESILRYSAYLYYKDTITQNGGKVKDYVASNRATVDGLDSIEDKAYQLSKDLIGAYDEVGKMGQAARRHFIPFYSFTEANFKRYYRLIKNIITSDASIPVKTGKLMLKMWQINLLALLMIAWNRLVMEDEDDKLPPSVRNVPHITLGSNGDEIYAFRQLGSFSEILEWLGFEDYKWTSEDILAPVDKAYGMITPFVKLPIEMFSGLNFYPSLTEPRAIRDKTEHFFSSFGVADIYKAVAGKPTKGASNIAKGGLIYSYDVKESAYYEFLDIKRDYQGSEDNNIYMPNAKSNSLYYMKQAIRYGDKEAALKYVDEYFENGGTGRGINKSFSALNPLYGFTNDEEKKNAFLDSLDENGKKKYEIAMDYYENDLALPNTLTQYLNAKYITDEQAKNLLKNYIKSEMK